MTNKEYKDKATEIFRELFALTKKVSFTDVTLKDGSILRTIDEALAKGSKVTLVGKDGTETPATDGDVTTDKDSIVTIKSGVVENITEKAPEKMETPADVKPIESAAPVVEAETEVKDEVEGMDIEALKGIIENLVARIAKLEESLTSTSMTVAKMSAEPAAAPFNFNPHEKFVSKFSEGSIGYEMEKIKFEKKTKREKAEKAKFEAFSMPSNSTPTNKVENFSETKKKPSLDGFGGFSVESTK